MINISKSEGEEKETYE